MDERRNYHRIICGLLVLWGFSDPKTRCFDLISSSSSTDRMVFAISEPSFVSLYCQQGTSGYVKDLLVVFTNYLIKCIKRVNKLFAKFVFAKTATDLNVRK